jgi:hypothetical protein
VDRNRGLLEPFEAPKQPYEDCWRIGEPFETDFGPFRAEIDAYDTLNPSGAFETSQASFERFESIEFIDRTPLNA